MLHRNMKTVGEVADAIRALRYRILTSEVSEKDTRKDNERADAVKIQRALAFLDLAKLALEN